MELWTLMEIPAAELGRGTNVRVEIGGDPDDLARQMAGEMAGVIEANNGAGRPTCCIVPVGPVGQYPILAELIRDRKIDCSRVTFINMDEFLDADGGFLDTDHPLSFRGFMDRSFYQRLPEASGFAPENRIFPDPERPGAVEEDIRARGGVDVCFGGIGLNGHLAFNEPRLEMGVNAFAALPSRVVELAPASRAHMAVNLSCSIDLVPERAVTVGMREILSAGRLYIQANRPWQRGVVRQLLHGPVSPGFPASYLQRHGDATLVVADFVAEAREVRLR